MPYKSSFTYYDGTPFTYNGVDDPDKLQTTTDQDLYRKAKYRAYKKFENMPAKNVKKQPRENFSENDIQDAQIITRHFKNLLANREDKVIHSQDVGKYLSDLMDGREFNDVPFGLYNPSRSDRIEIPSKDDFILSITPHTNYKEFNSGKYESRIDDMTTRIFQHLIFSPDFDVDLSEVTMHQVNYEACKVAESYNRKENEENYKKYEVPEAEDFKMINDHLRSIAKDGNPTNEQYAEKIVSLIRDPSQLKGLRSTLDPIAKEDKFERKLLADDKAIDNSLNFVMKYVNHLLNDEKYQNSCGTFSEYYVKPIAKEMAYKSIEKDNEKIIADNQVNIQKDAELIRKHFNSISEKRKITQNDVKNFVVDCINKPETLKGYTGKIHDLATVRSYIDDDDDLTVNEQNIKYFAEGVTNYIANISKITHYGLDLNGAEITNISRAARSSIKTNIEKDFADKSETYFYNPFDNPFDDHSQDEDYEKLSNTVKYKLDPETIKEREIRAEQARKEALERFQAQEAERKKQLDAEKKRLNELERKKRQRYARADNSSTQKSNSENVKSEPTNNNQGFGFGFGGNNQGGNNSVPFGTQSSPFGTQSSPFGAQPSPFGAQPSPFGEQPSPFGTQPSPFGENTTGFGNNSENKSKQEESVEKVEDKKSAEEVEKEENVVEENAKDVEKEENAKDVGKEEIDENTKNQTIYGKLDAYSNKYREYKSRNWLVRLFSFGTRKELNTQLKELKDNNVTDMEISIAKRGHKMSTEESYKLLNDFKIKSANSKAFPIREYKALMKCAEAEKQEFKDELVKHSLPLLLKEVKENEDVLEETIQLCSDLEYDDYYKKFVPQNNESKTASTEDIKKQIINDLKISNQEKDNDFVKSNEKVNKLEKTV